MDVRAGPRRVQYSSCDECRRARVACDASRVRKLYGGSQCTRCDQRQKPCTFEWMKNARGPAHVSRTRNGHRSAEEASQNSPDAAMHPRCGSGENVSSYINLTPPSPPWDVDVPTTLLQASQAETDWLHALYLQSFEVVFGSWMGTSCNPFTFQGPQAEDSPTTRNGDLIVSISSICSQLDRWTVDEPAACVSNQLYSTRGVKAANDETATQRSLSLAIQSFAARWLPLITPTTSTGISSREYAKMLWREARTDMLNVINRPCYRAALSLILFGLTPIPEGISDEEENAGLPGAVCIQAALQHIYLLRARQRSLQFNGTKVSTGLARRLAPSMDPEATTNFINAESVAFWAALTFDTSASLTFSSRPLLSPGLLGHDIDCPWSLVRSCTGIFREMTADWHNAGFVMTDMRAQQVIAAGAAWKLVAWKLSAVFREAVRDGHDEKEVHSVYGSILEAIKQYNEVYRDHMESCRRRIHFLSPQTKICYYELIIHYNLSILLAIDAIETTGQFHLLPGIRRAQADAESSILDALTLGLETNFSIHLPLAGQDAYGRDQMDSATQAHIVTQPIIALDPYPHHVVAAVKLLRRAIGRDLAAEAITVDAFQSVLLVLKKVLELLPDGSQSVQAAREQIVEGYS